jgi:hypothetical protein
MALIKCSECGKETSDKVTFCRHCGSPIASLKIDNEKLTQYDQEEQKKVNLPFSLQDIEGVLLSDNHIRDGYLVFVYDVVSEVYVLKMVSTDDARYSPEEGASCTCYCRVKDINQVESYYKKLLYGYYLYLSTTRPNQYVEEELNEDVSYYEDLIIGSDSELKPESTHPNNERPTNSIILMITPVAVSVIIWLVLALYKAHGADTVLSAAFFQVFWYVPVLGSLVGLLLLSLKRSS